MCEIQGEVGTPSYNPRRCTNAVGAAVSVNGLLSLYTCRYHELKMKKFWSGEHVVVSSTIGDVAELAEGI